MKTEEKDINTLFCNPVIYKVPLYQRHYVWNQKNWQHLWNDIREKADLRFNPDKKAKAHFTGAIVIQSDKNVDIKFEIIDGQQRLTTFQILLCAIRDIICKDDRYKNNDLNNIVKRIREFILNDPLDLSGEFDSADPVTLYKVLPREGADRNAFRSIVDSDTGDARIVERNTLEMAALPQGTGELQRVVVFAQGDKALEAEGAGADFVGNDELMDKIVNGWIDFDVVIATPDLMKDIMPKLGRILGPRGLMPNALNGNLTMDITERIQTIKGGRGHLIYAAYDYFTDVIRRYSRKRYERISNLFDSILDNFVVVQISAGLDDEPEKIFQTINGTGQALDQFDLLRNNLFLRARTGDERDHLYRKHWYQFEEKHGFWRKPGVVDDFFENFLRIKLRKNLSTRRNLFDLYQQYHRKLSTEMKLDEVDLQLVKCEFSELSRYAKVYQEIRDPNSELGFRMKFYEKFKNEFNLAPQSLKLFVLYITNELGMSGTERDRVFDLLESYAVRWILCNDTSTAPAGEINSLFLGILNKQNNFHLLDLWHLLSNKFPRDEKVNSMLTQLLPNFNKTPIRSGKLSGMQKLGTYISDRIKNPLSAPGIDELHKRFCEIWPSAEALMQSCLKDGLPIVYSRLPASVETKPRLEPYKFVTYDGIRELLEYEIQQGNWVGIDADSPRKGKVGLPTEEILFAFPATAMSSLQSPLNHIQHDVKKQGLTSLPKEETLQGIEWLQLRVKDENIDFKHWSLPKVDATVVTRIGHVLRGKLKSFTDDTIYIEIEDQIVSVYMHGIYDLQIKKKRQRGSRGSGGKSKMPWQFMIEAKKNQPIKFMCNKGIIELSPIISTSQSDITGFDNIKGTTRQLSLEKILFAYSAKVKSNDLPLKVWTDVETPKPLQRPSHPPEQPVLNSILRVVASPENKFSLKVTTHAGHMLQGRLKNHDQDAICMEIKKQNVMVFRHALSAIHLITSGDSMLERETFKIVTYEKSIELSQIETGPSELTGIDKSGKQLPPLQKLNILFAYSVKTVSDVEPIRIDDQVEKRKLEPIQKGGLRVKGTYLDSAMAEKITVRILTRRGHVLEGTIEHFDKYEIHLRINGQIVIVYRHGLYEISTE